MQVPTIRNGEFSYTPFKPTFEYVIKPTTYLFEFLRDRVIFFNPLKNNDTQFRPEASKNRRYELIKNICLLPLVPIAILAGRITLNARILVIPCMFFDVVIGACEGAYCRYNGCKEEVNKIMDYKINYIGSNVAFCYGSIVTGLFISIIFPSLYIHFLTWPADYMIGRGAQHIFEKKFLPLCQHLGKKCGWY